MIRHAWTVILLIASFGMCLSAPVAAQESALPSTTVTLIIPEDYPAFSSQPPASVPGRPVRMHALILRGAPWDAANVAVVIDPTHATPAVLRRAIGVLKTAMIERRTDGILIVPLSDDGATAPGKGIGERAGQWLAELRGLPLEPVVEIGAMGRRLTITNMNNYW